METDQPANSWGAATLRAFSIASVFAGVLSGLLALCFWHWIRFLRLVDLGENDFSGLIYMLFALAIVIGLLVSSLAAIGFGVPAVHARQSSATAWAGLMLRCLSLLAAALAFATA